MLKRLSKKKVPEKAAAAGAGASEGSAAVATPDAGPAPGAAASAAGTPAPPGSAGLHGTPAEGMTCKASWEDIDADNYCEYRSAPSGKWLPSGFASDTVRHLLKTQFRKYLDDVEKATKDCAAAVRRLVNKGPPVYLSDQEALPLVEGDTHIDMLWFANGGGAAAEELSSALEGAFVGDAREALWDTQKEVLQAMEQVEEADASEK